MFLQALLEREMPSTMLTAKRLLSSMYHPVRNQVTLAREALFTHITLELLDPFMPLHMPFEVSARCEGCSTGLAFVRLLTRVRANMPNQIRAQRETLAAYSTFMWS